MTRRFDIPSYGPPLPHLNGRPRSAFRIDETFEDFEKDLNQFFDVRPMPLVPWHSALPALGWHDAQQYYLTWNNVVLESYTAEDGAAVRNVFMPAYGEKAEELGVNPAIRHFFDSRAEEVWRQLKFRVHRLAGMEDLAFFGGSAHCITKTLRRGPFRPPAA